MQTPFELISQRLSKKLDVANEPAPIKQELMRLDLVYVCELYEHLHALHRDSSCFSVTAIGLAFLISVKAGLKDSVLERLRLLVKKFDESSPRIEVGGS